MQRVDTLLTTCAMLSLVILVGLATSTMAGPREYGYDRLARLAQRLDALGLDAATRAAVHATINEAQAEQQQLRAQLRDAYHGLRALMQQDLPDEAAVAAQLDTIGALETALKKQTTLTWLHVLAQLTPEQRASLRDTVRSRRDAQKGHGR